jgi:sugar lactone lactonase YvrE
MDIFVEGLSFSEGPRWHAGSLWFSDFYTHSVHRADASGKLTTVATVENRPSGLGFMPDGALLIVSMLDRKLLKLVEGKLRDYADLSGYAGGPCNDMFVTRAGRAYVGNFGYDRHNGGTPRATQLIRVDPDGSVHREAGTLTFPNGIALTPDGNTLVVAETHVGRISKFRVGADGALSEHGTFAAIPGFEPDGLCMDAEGAVWVADITGHRVIRLFDGGRIAQSVSTGADRVPLACMLGGDDLRTLFVCTNTGFGPKMADRRDGRIDTVRVDVPGLG